MGGYLTRKQMIEVLKDTDILDFVRNYYVLLQEVNPTRISYTRTEQEKRLEALARLTVGNEICSAVGFDGDKLLFATNKNAHNNCVIHYTISFEHPAGNYYNCHIYNLTLNITFGEYFPCLISMSLEDMRNEKFKTVISEIKKNLPQHIIPIIKCNNKIYVYDKNRELIILRNLTKHSSLFPKTGEAPVMLKTVDLPIEVSNEIVQKAGYVFSVKYPKSLYFLPFSSPTAGNFLMPYTLKPGKSISFSPSDYQPCTQIEFKVLPEEHCIPGVPDITCRCSLRETVPLRNANSLCVLPSDVASDTIFKNMSFSTSALHRRAEVLVEHLSFVINAHCHPNALTREKAGEIAEKRRSEILKNSLVWEIIQWYESFILSKEAAKASQHGDTSKAEKETLVQHMPLRLLVDQLNQNFIEFKRNNQATVTTSRLVNSWADQIYTLITQGSDKLTVPEYIRTDISKFVKRIKKYFRDIEMLENLACSDADKKGDFSAMLAKSSPFNTSTQTFIEVIDDLEDDVHAEARLLWKSLQPNSKPLEFIATSKYCCPHCGLLLHRFGQRAPGIHGNIFPKWNLSDLFKTPPMLQLLFGESLYDQYNKLLRFQFNGSCVPKGTNKGALALAAIQSLGNLTEKDILEDLKLGTIYLRNDQEQYASDSDSEETCSKTLPTPESKGSGIHVHQQLCF